MPTKTTYKRKANTGGNGRNTKKKTTFTKQTKTAGGKRKATGASKPAVKQVRRTTALPPSLIAEAAVVNNAFSSATNQPRIPDGKATHSMGNRHQVVKELTIPYTVTNDGNDNINITHDGTMHVFLYPGMGAGAVIGGTADGQKNFTGAQSDNTWSVMGFEDFGAMRFDKDYPDVTASDHEAKLVNDEKASQWRLVSQGINMKLLNGCEEDDGWFEAIRLKEVMDENDWALLPKDNDWANGYNSDELTVAPYPVFLKQQLNNRSLADEPGYQTGLLRDLHRLQFDNRPRADEVEFNPFAEHYQVPNMSGDTTNLGTEDPDHCWDTYPAHHNSASPSDLYRFKLGNSHANRVIKGHVDFSHDIVYIRIHGRKGPSYVAPGEGATASSLSLDSPTRILCHLVSNTEIIFGTSEKESKYMIPGLVHPGIARLVQGKKKNGKPSKILPGDQSMG